MAAAPSDGGKAPMRGNSVPSPRRGRQVVTAASATEAPGRPAGRVSASCTGGVKVVRPLWTATTSRRRLAVPERGYPIAHQLWLGVA